jgi:hypothetical protein
MVDPKLVDPAGKYKGNEIELRRDVVTAINSAEKFHRKTLDTYYHPSSYAFYGADSKHKSFGAVRWVARDPGAGAVFTESNLRSAKLAGDLQAVGRSVKVEDRTVLDFDPAPQDVGGDGTVPSQSGAGPLGKVKQLFELRGVDHQDAFNNEAVLLLTQHLVAKLVQEMS